MSKPIYVDMTKIRAEINRRGFKCIQGSYMFELLRRQLVREEIRRQYLDTSSNTTK